MADFVADSTVVVKANPAANFEFSNWEGDVDPQANPLTLRLTRDINIHAVFVTKHFADDFETGDFASLPWMREGDVAPQSSAPWFIQDEIVAAGEFAVRSGEVQDSQRSSLLLRGAMREGIGSFEYKVSSEDGWDFLEFFVNAIRIQRWSGEMGWATYEFPVAAGENTLEWRYVKDINGNAGLDAAFIDNVDLPISIAPDESAPAILSLTQTSDGQFRLKISGQLNQEYTIEASGNLRDWNTLATRAANNGVIFFSDPNSASNPIRYYRAVVR